jgi:AraC family transcriptional regulator
MPFFPAIQARGTGMPIGLVFPSREDGSFDYVCALPVARLGDVPDGLIAHEIPHRTYAVFDHVGHVSRIGETYAAIFNHALPDLGRAQADAPIVEDHNPSFDPRTGEGGLTIWVPLAAQPLFKGTS